MGALRHLTSGEHAPLHGRHRVGRGPDSDLQLDQPHVSGEHALLQWSDGWVVRDLGSRNGTFVGERRVEPGEAVALTVGDELGFGQVQDRWALVDSSPPEPSATASDGRRVVGRDGILVLPSREDPQVTVMADLRDAWCVEDASGIAPVHDRDAIEVGGQSWQLRLPEAIQSTVLSDATSLDECALRFTVSLDEETVQVSLVAPDKVHDLGARSHHYLLLTLARARLGEVRGVPSGEAGWVYQDDLARDLRISPSLLNIHVHRARSQLAALSVLGATGIVERRPGAKQLRVGIASLDVERAS